MRASAGVQVAGWFLASKAREKKGSIDLPLACFGLSRAIQGSKMPSDFCILASARVGSLYIHACT